MVVKWKSYKKEHEYSYCFGAFPAIEMLDSRPELALEVLVSASFRESPAASKIYELCRSKHIEVQINDQLLERLSPKENCYVIGVFKKYHSRLEETNPHVVLVNPGNMGNLGTIIRTILGFGIKNLAIISPGVDILDPKVIRASMGALFKINFQYYDSFKDYRDSFKEHRIFTFMLGADNSIEDVEVEHGQRFSLVFGNESSGLDADFMNYGMSVVIPHTNAIDSLNLTVAVGIAAYEFSKKRDLVPAGAS
jgi:TrmH family RNA methyltransferase